MTDEADAIDHALSVDALRKAAKQGEPAAAALLIYGEANPAGAGGLASFVKRAIIVSSGDCVEAKRLRRVAARALSFAALDAPTRRMRQTARAYLKSERLSVEASALTPRILLDLAYEHARRMLMHEPARELSPTWLLANGDGLITIVVTPFGDTAAKDAAAAGMRRMMRDNDVIAYCHLAEAWMGAPESTVRPRDDPERVEIVTALAYTATEGESAYWAIKRDADGKLVELELLERGEDATGRFSWLLSIAH